MVVRRAWVGIREPQSQAKAQARGRREADNQTGRVKNCASRQTGRGTEVTGRVESREGRRSGKGTDKEKARLRKQADRTDFRQAGGKNAGR